ncbi:MAG: PmoA family protein, partial [Armatimonadetes bacterium]|nr:PmoA family protein [Armatimonadota bacterium]
MRTTKLLIRSGNASREYCPLSLPVAGEPGRAYWLSWGSLQLPVQATDGELWCVIPELPADQTVVATLEGAEGEHPHRVSVEESEDRIAIYTDGKLFTAYIKAGNPARPCFYPVRAPGGVSVTRHWPMRHDIPHETNDHVHHRSMWIAFGDVNGVDNWSEEPGHGYTLHRQTLRLYSGIVCGGFETLSDWTDAQGTQLLEQRLRVRV